MTRVNSNNFKPIMYIQVPEASPDFNSKEDSLLPSSPRRNYRLVTCIGGMVLLLSAFVLCFSGTNEGNSDDSTLEGISRGLKVDPSDENQCVPPGLEDTCNTEESYGQCLLLQQDGCHKIISTGMCPPRFECASQCFRPHPGDDCHTEESYGQCLMLEHQGCKRVASTRSCPPQFSCLDLPAPTQPIEPVPVHPIEPIPQPVTKTMKAATPALPIESMCLAPRANDDCHTEESYQECLAIEKNGCTQMMATFSCPPQYRCIDAPTPMPPIETTCSAPGYPNSCDNEESYHQCLALEGEGCQTMISTASCPPQYACADPTPTLPVESNCVAPSNSDDCITQESYDQCLALKGAGCQRMISTASCPPQYQCADPTPTLPIESQLCASPDGCQTQESYRECLGFELQGCQNLAATGSCPPKYHCVDPVPSMPPISMESQLCASPDGCQTEESFLECLHFETQGCQKLLATTSCPPQYQCDDEHFAR